ncbi:MAG: Na(+)/H(+) antiporter NhaA [Hyphomicrobiales bacterium]|nr:Na(+)/H(+) antiporter NhaA [Hyphomicrobiales bacterium]
MNRFNVSRLWPYFIIGTLSWVLVLRSGVHARIAGVLLAFALPLRLPVIPNAGLPPSRCTYLSMVCTNGWPWS